MNLRIRANCGAILLLVWAATAGAMLRPSPIYDSQVFPREAVGFSAVPAARVFAAQGGAGLVEVATEDEAPAVIRVPEDIKSIQVALHLVAEHGKILVNASHNDGPVVINKPVTIEGMGGATRPSINSIDGPAVTMAATQATLRNLRIMGLRRAVESDGPESPPEAPKDPCAAPDQEVVSWPISGTRRAAGPEALAEPQDGVAIDVAQGELLVDDCEMISDGWAGVNVHGAGAARLVSSEIWGGRHGVRVVHGGAAEIIACRIRDIERIGLMIGADAEVMVQGTELRACREAGAVVRDGGRASFTLCEISSRGRFGVVVVEDGELLMDKFLISTAEVAGLSLSDGRATLRRGKIRHTGAAGAVIGAGGVADLEECDISNVRNDGVFVADGGAAALRNCTLTGNGGQGLMVHRAGTATVSGSRLTANRGSGVIVSDGGRAELSQCEISGNQAVNVAVLRDGFLRARHCRIFDGPSGGVLFGEGGAGSVESSQIYANHIFGVNVLSNRGPLLQNCHIYENVYYGVIVRRRARVTIESCVIADNELSDVQREQGAIVFRQ